MLEMTMDEDDIDCISDLKAFQFYTMFTMFYDDPVKKKLYEEWQRQQKALATEQGGNDEKSREMVGI